jgi:hypothetical protein
VTGADAAILAAIISGSVALLAVAGSVITTWLSLRNQRKAEDGRRDHERDMRLLDLALKAAIDFLAAADQVTGARFALHAAEISLDGASSVSDQQSYDEFRQAWMEARDQSIAAVRDARDAYAALRLLVPATARPGGRYLDLCLQADPRLNAGRADRERARQAAEEAIRDALGIDLPGDGAPAELTSQPEEPAPAEQPAGPPTEQAAQQSADPPAE